MKIGIPLRKSNNKLYINKSYINYFSKMGEIILLFDKSKLDMCDVFILPGGYDIDPFYYCQNNSSSNNIDIYNDMMDFKIINHALNNDKVLLGICRGCQSINTFFGGKLNQDIKNHQNENHFIKFKNKHYLVNSYHHQAISIIGDDLEIIAKSIDDNIEIIKYKKIIGIAFHPELMNTPMIDFKIFNLLNEA